MEEFKSISKFYNKKEKNIKKKTNFLFKIVNKLLICLIIFVSVLIVLKINPKLKQDIYNFVYDNNLSFAKVNDLYRKYFGNVLPFDHIFPETDTVFNEKLNYNGVSLYKDGVKLEVNYNYLVPVIESGIVVFIGEKANYGQTIIVEQADGINVWYGNINTSGIKIYDYVEKGSLLGEAYDDKIYLVFQKDGKYLDYKDYI